MRARSFRRPCAGLLRPSRLARGHRRLLRLNFNRRIEIGARGFSERIAQLIAQHAGAHLFDLAFAEFAQLKRPEGNADEPRDGQTQMFEHALDLAILAFSEPHRQPAIGALLAIELGVDAGIAHAVDRHAFGELIEHRLIGFAMRAHAIAPEPARRRQFENAGEAAVVRQQQQAFGIDIEPADAHQPRRLGRMLSQKIEDRRPAFRVLMGRDKPARLMKEKEPRALTLRQGLAIDNDLIAGLDNHRRGRQRFAIDRDAALGDPRLGVAARAETGPGNDLGDAIALCVRSGGLRWLWAAGAESYFYVGASALIAGLKRRGDSGHHGE